METTPTTASKVELDTSHGLAVVNWNYPKIGACSDPVETLLIHVFRCVDIPVLSIGYDLHREGWSIGEIGPDIDNAPHRPHHELAFIPYNRFYTSTAPEEEPDEHEDQ